MFESVSSYYRFHSKIYDLTRWIILFGRNDILELVPQDFQPKSVLDLGCGTGKHLEQLAVKFPNAAITGVDLSSEMLKKAETKIQDRNNVNLVQSSWEDYLENSHKFDLILCSYSLTLSKKPTELIDLLSCSLSNNGILIVVDFKDTPFKFFERWMKFNHVDISGNVYEEISQNFITEKIITHKAWFGLWKYFLGVTKSNGLN